MLYEKQGRMMKPAFWISSSLAAAAMWSCLALPMWGLFVTSKWFSWRPSTEGQPGVTSLHTPDTNTNPSAAYKLAKRERAGE